MTASHTTDLDMGSRLSLLWIFYMFNAAYIDITTLYYSVFINHHAKVHYTQAFLLGAGVLIEISISMVVRLVYCGTGQIAGPTWQPARS